MTDARGSTWPTGETQLVAVIGDPVRQSLSPQLHNAAFAALGMDWVYVALRTPPERAGEAIRGARALSVRGLSVTMPHKLIAAEIADRRSDEVELLGAANTLLLGEDIVAFSTDGQGFLNDLRLGLGVDPAGLRCVVIGAGGAGRAVVLALAQSGAAEVLVVNRDRGRGESAALLAGSSGRVAELGEVASADLVVNATPFGMVGAAASFEASGRRPGSDELLSTIHEGQVFYDLVYRPAETPLLRGAARRGLRARGGLGMLVEQAALQFQLFTGREPPREVMWRAATAVGAEGLEPPACSL